MRVGWLAIGWIGLACIGCGGGALAPGAVPTTSAVTGCEVGAPLAGAAYDLAKSRFAFGSTPVRGDEFGFVRWVGKDGVVAIEVSGGEIGSLNGGAPEASLPDWSSDTAALEAHVSAYFASFGVASCQAPDAQELDGAEGRTISLPRSVDGIPVSESEAYARFDDQDQTTNESFYWPTIPADVVTAARGLHVRLADPTALAAYKAKLPADAQGDGGVVVHHTSAASTTPFASAATYDVVMTVGLLGMPAVLSFDADGNPVPNAW